MSKVTPKKYAVKFRYETPIKGIIEIEHGYRIAEAFDMIDAILIIKDDGNYRQCSEPVVYEAYEVNEEV
jgi:hypothetical protein